MCGPWELNICQGIMAAPILLIIFAVLSPVTILMWGCYMIIFLPFILIAPCYYAKQKTPN